MVAGERPVLEVERTSISTQVDPPMYATMKAAKMMPRGASPAVEPTAGVHSRTNAYMADSIVAEHAMKRRSSGSCDKCSKAIARGPPGGMRKVANLAGRHESIAIGGIGFAGAGG